MSRIPVVLVPRLRCPTCGSADTRGYCTRGQARYARCLDCKSPFKIVAVDKLPVSGNDTVAGVGYVSTKHMEMNR